MIDQAGLRADLFTRAANSLVLTYDGFIVDATGEKLHSSRGKVEYVMAVVLPEDCTAVDLYQTESGCSGSGHEGKIQLGGRSAARALGIRDLSESPAAIARRMGVRHRRMSKRCSAAFRWSIYTRWLGARAKTTEFLRMTAAPPSIASATSIGASDVRAFADFPSFSSAPYEMHVCGHQGERRVLMFAEKATA